jgi:hypothetical protein
MIVNDHWRSVVTKNGGDADLFEAWHTADSRRQASVADEVMTLLIDSYPADFIREYATKKLREVAHVQPA